MKKLFLCILLLGSVALIQHVFDFKKPERPDLPPFIPSLWAVKVADLGLHSAASGFMWIEAIQNIFAPGTRRQFILPDYIKLVSDLDPRFSYPYAFGTLVLPDLKLVDEGIALGERGVREADPDWRVPYYLATTYHIFRRDRISAVKYFALAASMPDAPVAIKRIAAAYGGSRDLREQTKNIWISIYETSSGDEVVREKARAYIFHYEILELLEKAAMVYKQKTGRYPKSLQDLITVKILKQIPLSPLNLEYYIDERGRARIKNQ